MTRPRIESPVLVRSTDPSVNGRIVRESVRHRKNVEKTRALGVFIKNAFGTPGRFIYIGT